MVHRANTLETYSRLSAILATLPMLREAPEQLAVFVDLDPDQGRGLGRATMPESISTLLFKCS